MEENGELLTVRQVADLKGVSRSAVYTAIEEERLPSTRVLDRVAVREADATAWQPVRYAQRAGAKGHGGRQTGFTMSDKAKEKLSASQKARWEKLRDQTLPTNSTNQQNPCSPSD